MFGPLPPLDGVPMHAGPVADSAWRALWHRIPLTRQEDISRVYVNIGKSIAAYERRIELAPSHFDRYVDDELTGRRARSWSARTRRHRYAASPSVRRTCMPARSRL